MDGHLTAIVARTLRQLAVALPGFCGAAAYGQLLEVNGGASSLYQTQGGSILLHGSAYQSEVGAGLVSGRLVGGGRFAYRDKNNLYSAGVEEVRFDLPTDLFNSDHRLLGVGMDMKSVHPGTALELFAGGTSQRFDTPLFTGVRVDQPAAALILQHSFSPSVLSTTHLLLGNPSTALQAVQWTPRRWLRLAATGGFGGTSHYEAVSADLKRPLVDLKAAYIDAPPAFHRLGSNPGISPEPIHENLLLTVRSSARNPIFTFTGGRQNFLTPASTAGKPNGTVPASLISTSNQISASTSLRTFALTGTVITSAYNGDSNLAFVLSASAAPNQRLRVQTSYFQSRLLRESFTARTQTPVQTQVQTQVQASTHTRALQTQTGVPATDIVVTSLEETLTHRYGLNQTVTFSNGQTSIGYGGSIFSNLISLSADYETFYIPTRPEDPFQQTLVLDLQINLFGRLTLHGGTFVSPAGKLLYTANAHAIQSRSPAAGPAGEHNRFGLYIVQGRVVDSKGDPLPGAAIAVGANLLYTDSLGEFFFRDKRPQSYTLRVLGDQFLDGHTYGVVSQPVIVPSIKAEDQHLLIVVKRVADQAGQSDAAPCTPAVGPRTKRRDASSQPACDDRSSPRHKISWLRWGGFR